MATLAANEYHLPDPNYRNFDHKTDPHEVAFADLLAKSKALPEGQIVGAMLKWQRADGYAWYIVTKDKPLTLQHVPYGDAWTIEPALIRGLRKQDVLDKLAQERRFAALFSR